MNKVYVVEAGEYSDCHIVGIFSTRELAENCRKAVNGHNVEEWPIDQETIPEGYLQFVVAMDEEGDVRVCSQGHESLGTVDRWTWQREWDQHPTSVKRDTYHYEFQCTIFARDQEHAIKIANERRSGSKADPRWLEEKEAAWKERFKNVSPEMVATFARRDKKETA